MNLLTYLDGKIDQSNKILLYDMFAGIGDVLWRTSLFREIKRRNPNLKLYVSSVGNYWKLLLQNNENISGTIDRIGNPPYTSGVDHYVSDKLCPHVISDYARNNDSLDAIEIWSGLSIRDKSFVYTVTEEEKVWATKFLSKYSRPIIGIQLKASSWVRNPVPDELLRLIRMLRYNNFTVIVMDNHQFGFKDEGIVNMASGYNIREVASIIQQTNLMITPDSGLMHFAGHFKIPTVSIFGGSDPKCRLKYYTTIHPILNKQKLDCQFCWSHSYYCPKNINPAPCLVNIKAEDIYNIVKEIL